MAQYDKIGTQYDFIKTTPFNDIEQYNFRSAIQPLFAGGDCHVIEFASGTGFYSERMLRWGAASVTGVELSSAMVDGANERLANTDLAPRAKFIHGDGREVKLYPAPSPQKFDVAASVWFLNYAMSYGELEAMFKTIALNLKDDGVFIGVCLPPIDDFERRIGSYTPEAMNRTGVRFDYLAPLESGEGYPFRVVALDPTHPEQPVLEFESFHLKKRLYESAARAGGMAGRLEWCDCDFAVDGWRQKVGLQHDDDAWEKLNKAPHMCILKISKK
ncbi:hypothetical protein NLG97_g402 [Lecanicillium saksenae]|uniref:Uncharacterized protein n=1 Tax=Lecanicillium saksenae TaxID=468837 RepID=A0ACC1R6N3_9HYPO|nr:hypothetical protein NLG97_g402 [Lecanicillium saksenae]